MKTDDLDTAFELMQNTIEENSRSEVKNLWMVCYRIWQFYLILNQKIASGETLEEQTAVIEKFISFYKDRNPIEAELPKPQKVEDVNFDPHLHEVMRELQKERVLFGKNLRRIKAAQKSGKTVKKPPTRKKSKWVKS